MSALDDARAALAHAIDTDDPGVERDVLGALIAYVERRDRIRSAVRDMQDMDRTDDEREDAMATLWAIFNPGFAPLTEDHPDRAYYYAMGSDLVASGFRRQVPITDEWEYGVEVTSSTGEPVVPGMTWTAPVASAEMFFPSFIRHVRRRKAGPWEPVEAAERAR